MLFFSYKRELGEEKDIFKKKKNSKFNYYSYYKKLSDNNRI